MTINNTPKEMPAGDGNPTAERKPFTCFACGAVSVKLGLWVQAPAVPAAIVAACPSCANRFETEPEYFAVTKEKANISASRKMLPFVLDQLGVTPAAFVKALVSLEKNGVSFNETDDAFEKALGLPKGAVYRAERRAIAVVFALTNPPDDLRRLKQEPHNASYYN